MEPQKTGRSVASAQKGRVYVPSSVKIFFSDLLKFSSLLFRFIFKHVSLSFLILEAKKSVFVTILYRQRGKYARRLMHTGMASLSAVGIVIAPVVAQEFPGRTVDPWSVQSSSVLSVSAEANDVTTEFSDKQFRDKIIKYTVQDGDTISSIALKFNISEETVRWQNNLSLKSTIKAGDELEILPVSGISHKVQKGDTIYTIAKKYDADAQNIVNFPFNTFVNDETFELAVGQVILVPDGVKPEEKSGGTPAAPRTRQMTPNAGSVTATGRFSWPTSGSITSPFSWYHPAIDIANRAAPPILAADSGKVIEARWDSTGYGMMVLIDHGNGYKTRYAHMQAYYVTVGQTVNRGDTIGKMGSTGRSTGTHLHFEIYQNGTRISPLGALSQ